MRRVALAIGYMIIGAGVIAALVLAWPVITTIITILAPFVVAAVVAYLFNPIVNVAERRLHIGRVGGVLLVNLLILLVCAIFVAIIIPILSTQIQNAWEGIRTTTTDKVVPWVNRQVMGEEGMLSGEAVEDMGEHFTEVFEGAPDSETIPREMFGVMIDEWAESARAGYIDEEEVAQLAERARDWAGRQPREEIPVAEFRAARAEWAAEAETGLVPWHVLVERTENWLSEHDMDLESLSERALASTQLRDAASTAATEGAGVIGRTVVWIGDAVGAIITSTIFIVFVFLVSFYLLIDFGALRGAAEVIVPQKHETRFFDVANKMDVAVGGFIRGQLISATLVGFLTFVGLTALGMKQYSVLIGFVAFIGHFIPYLGPVAGATPAILYMLLSDAHDDIQTKLIFGGLVVVLFGFIQFLDGFFFQPKIVGKNAQLHPIAVILALATGAQFGLIGMIIAVPAACVVRVLIKEFYWDKREETWRRQTGKENLDDREPVKKKRRRKKKATGAKK